MQSARSRPSDAMLPPAGEAAVASLLPRTAGGHHFVAYGDCCSGMPGTAHERNFRAVNAVFRRLQPPPEFVCFLGDHIVGMTPDVAALRQQWQHFHSVECAGLFDAVPAVFHLTSNHNTYSADSVAVWRDQFPDLPANGAPGEAGLSYWVRRGNLLLVMLHTALTERGGDAGIGEAVLDGWLDSVLRSQADADYKLVFGHHPVHPVNGYADSPKWCIPPQEGMRLWDCLVRHGVQAYVCSHIIAFDVQVQHGVLQVTSGGAGTVYGPDGAMPGSAEYRHLTQLAIDAFGLRLQTRDSVGALREWLTWPPAPAQQSGKMALPHDGTPIAVPEPEGWCGDNSVSHLLVWQFAGWTFGADGPPTCDLLRAESADGRHALTLGMDSGRLVVRRDEMLPADRRTIRWQTPVLPTTPMDVQVAIHTGMGPGGVLWRRDPAAPWSSMATQAAIGFADVPWCTHWHVTPTLPDAALVRPERLSWCIATDRFRLT